MCIAFAVCLRLPIPHGFSALPARNGFFLTPVFPSLQNKDATVNCHGIVPNVHDFTNHHICCIISSAIICCNNIIIIICCITVQNLPRLVFVPVVNRLANKRLHAWG